MRKILLPLLCLFVSAPLLADDYTTTTILNNPVGIFDNLTVSGNTTLNIVEIGARPQNTTTNPIMQTQSVRVYGTTSLMSASGSGSAVQIGGSLYLQGNNSRFTFSNVYVYSQGILYLGNASSGASLIAKDIYAKTIKTLSTFTEGTSGAEATLTLASGSPFRASTIKFWDGTNMKILPSPRDHGVLASWESITAGDSSDTYSNWSPLSSSVLSDDCTTVSDPISEYSCPSSETKSCTDSRLSVINKDYYSTTGGVYFSQKRVRTECKYASGSCSMADFVYSDPSLVCPFGVADISTYESNNNLGALCRALCGGKVCSGFSYCVVKDDNYNPISSGASGQAGTASCSRTQWAEGSGLECTNAWKEKTVRVLNCGGGSGELKYPAGNYYQSRSVQCSSAGSTGASPGTFLVIDYGHNTGI